MQKHDITMEWHYDVTMMHIMMSEVIITPHKYHRIIVQLGVFLHLAENDINSLNSRI